MTVFHVTAQPATIHDQVLVFTWDSDTGAVTGPDAAQVLEWVRTLRGQYVDATPHGTCWLLADPLHDPADMAVLVGRDHILPPELRSYYPRTVADDDDASDVEVQY